MMSSFFNKALEVTSEVTEISKSDILSKSRQTEVVDARSVLIEVLLKRGFYPSTIARYLSITPAGVRYYISCFEYRKVTNKLIVIYLEEIRKKLFPT